MSGDGAIRSFLKQRVVPLVDRVARAEFAACWTWANQVPGWTGRREAIALYEAVLALPPDPVVVEIGSFLGRSSIVLAGTCRRRGDGRVYCVDPFDGSGDDYSKPVYDAIRSGLSLTQVGRFRQNLRDAGVDGWIEVRQGTAEAVSRSWSLPIDLLFLDGDHSPAGMRAAHDGFGPFLKDGGILAVHNSADRVYREGHDGARRLVLETVREPAFSGVRCIDTTVFAIKRG